MSRAIDRVAAGAARYCAGCCFWADEGDNTGTCRRYAPTMPSGFPATADDDWCGDFEADPEVALMLPPFDDED